MACSFVSFASEPRLESERLTDNEFGQILVKVFRKRKYKVERLPHRTRKLNYLLKSSLRPTTTILRTLATCSVTIEYDGDDNNNHDDLSFPAVRTIKEKHEFESQAGYHVKRRLDTDYETSLGGLERGS